MILTIAPDATFDMVVMDIAGSLTATKAGRNYTLIKDTKDKKSPYSLLFPDIPYADAFIRDYMSILLSSRASLTDQSFNLPHA
jgi:hypothetical protein